jgi:PAS domain S-box-containing protein
MTGHEKTKKQLIEEMAEMRRRIAELETLETERNNAENTLRSLGNISDRTGIEYFQSIVAFIAGELGTEYALIGKLCSDGKKVETITVYAHGNVIENIEYGLRGTPCKNVMGKQPCIYPDRIQELFPEDKLLVEMKAESYAGIPVFASNGQPIGIIVTLGCKPMKSSEKERSISLLQIFSARVSSELERKEAEDDIRKAKASLAKAQQIAKIGNWDWDIAADKLWWSDEIFRIFGLNHHEFAVTYETFLKTVHPDDRGFVEQSVETALSEKKPYRIDHRIVLPDGDEKVVYEQAEILLDETGKPVRMIGTVQDVTELKHMEMELQKSKQELETKVEERTAALKSTVELLQNEIAERRKAEDKLQKSLDEKEVLLKEIHHRVKNNMTVITSLLQLQSGHIEDEKYKDVFNNSINRIRSMALIHEKLYKSKDLSKINFNDYLEDMINSMFMSYGLTSSKVVLKTDVKDVALGIDTAIPCGLIINELVSNSLKYAFPKDRAGEIKVSLCRNDKGEVEMRVRDNGIGMPEDFDFTMTDTLGLSLVNALVRQLQGKIELHREKGAGFIISFKPITNSP